MGTYKEAFRNLMNGFKDEGVLDYIFYDFSNKKFASSAQSRICRVSLNGESDYNRDALLMIFTIGKNVNRVVIQSEGERTGNPSSTYPQKVAALQVAKENNWKYIAMAISAEDFENEVIRDYIVCIESTEYATATVCVIDSCISYLEENNFPDFYRCRQIASNVEYTLSFVKKEKFCQYIAFFDNRPYNEENSEKGAAVHANLDKTAIFNAFEPWLTSYYNPDYTGKEKYEGYPKALVRLVEFMREQGVVDDVDLNDVNIEKYQKFLDIYNASDVIKDFDEKKLSSKAGSAALKKYIKYIEYLLSPNVDAFDYSVTAGDGKNKIFFGTPGCGKSYHIEHDILGKNKDTKEYDGEFLEDNIIRTTFYQDYSYTDFVGQILPKIVKGAEGEKDTVEYIFNPGPFTLALIQAISNPTKKVALVVEEINRGNAPAIFGDIFQLLDRDENNVSEYGIVNISMIDYLNDHTFIVDGVKKSYKFTEIKIPGNLYIYATMNTSDQNVYTLDTAFVRRWDREKIKNSFAKCNFKATKVPGMDYTWQEFVEAINTCITSHLEELQVNEDKQIGAFFVKEHLLSGSAEKFAYKVFDYLWNDVAKLEHGIFFNDFNTLDALIAAYVEKGVAVFKPGIFKEKVATPIQSEATDE